MTATTIGPALYERLADRLRHAIQYGEACRLMAQDALDLLEAVAAATPEPHPYIPPEEEGGDDE